ncbi:MAG: LCP family protein, partial [Candidatus Dojkabacteria bacterium]|nr:LCP family protein [Candidatus Dojkabacteria bacterium]
KLEGSGLPVLEQVVEGITGLEIQYHAMINFNGFVELIDAVGGVYVNVENSFTDYMYPLRDGYQTISFKAGPQLMDGDTALKYSRSRHSQQNGEGSDYARARRQQKVIDALKDAILSSETLLNPTKLMAMFSSIQNNVKVSEFTLEDIQAGVDILKDIKEETTSSTYSFVLDPTIGNYSLIGTDVVKNAGYAIAPKEGLGQYTKIKEFVQLSLNNPPLYSENPSIYIYNTGLGYQETYTKTNELREHFKYLNIRFMGTKYSDKEGVYIYSNKEGEYSSSVNTLASYLKIENISKPEYITTRLNNEDISLLFGKAVVVQPTEESTQ